MLAKFDPVESRNIWLRVGRLDFTNGLQPTTIPVAARSHFAQLQTSNMIDAHLVGLAGEVRPILERLVTWMEAQPEPDRLVFSGSGHREDAWSAALYEWRQVLGLCRWLLRGERAAQELTAALEADCQGLEQAKPEHAAAARAKRREYLSMRLAVALAANAPLLGLRLYDSFGPKRPSGLVAPVLRFGLWACRYLAEGGTRDATFVMRGQQMLTDSLLRKFFWEHARIEPALWLKAIYFDSGVVRTPEQAIAKAYDSMPSVERPDFVPG
jgi:hypothetical protein